LWENYYTFMAEKNTTADYIRSQEMFKQFLKQKGGKIPFDVFMQESLYGRPQSFYEHVTIGHNADFLTFASLPLFGELIGRHIKNAIDQDDIEPFCLELAGGMGVFKESLIRTMSDHGVDLDYVSIDHSAHLLTKQSQFGGRNIRGSALDLPLADRSIRGTVFMNELFDNLPFKVTRLRKNRYEMPVVEELFYGFEKPGRVGAVWETTTDERLLRYWDRQFAYMKRHFGFNPAWDLDSSVISTVNLNEERLVNELARVVDHGQVIIADYGYVLQKGIFAQEQTLAVRMFPSRKTSKLEDIHHKVYDADITAHVNFTDVMLLAEAAGFTIRRFDAQQHYVWDVVTPSENTLLKKQQELHPWHPQKKVLAEGGTHSGMYVLVLTK